MELKTDSLLAKYYCWAINEKLPPDICTLFWATLLSVLTFPIWLPAYFPLWRDELWHCESLGRRIWGGIKVWGTYVVFGIIGAAIIYDSIWKDIIKLNFSLVLLIGATFFTVAGTIICGSIALAGYGIYELSEWIKDRRAMSFTDERFVKREPTPSKLKVTWNAVRGKYCTKITWK